MFYVLASKEGIYVTFCVSAKQVNSAQYCVMVLPILRGLNSFPPVVAFLFFLFTSCAFGCWCCVFACLV